MNDRDSTTNLPRVVVADDEEGLLFLMVDALHRDGCRAEGFTAGREAIEWLATHSADLLVLDLRLADLPAPQFVQELRSAGRELPFIVVTGYGDERTAVEVMKQGALDYVMKESGMLELLPSIVRRALAVVNRDRLLAQANAAVRQREERQRMIIQTALDGFAQFDTDWRLIEVNPALCHLLGYTREKLLAADLYDIEIALVPEEMDRRMERIRQEGFAHCYTRLRHADGHHLDVEISVRADHDEFIGFVHDVTEQRRLEREVLQIGEEERRRFGCELHDNLGQQLTALEMMSSTLARELKTAAPGLMDSARGIAEAARKMIAQTRQLAHGLAPVALEDEGLRSALADLARTTTATGVRCRFESDPDVDVSDIATATHLYRIAQEAVNNALKHSKAKTITLHLLRELGHISLVIQDDGRGLPAQYAKRQGMGLRVIHHRARLIGAQLHLHNRARKGLRVVCNLPTAA